MTNGKEQERAGEGELFEEIQSIVFDVSVSHLRIYDATRRIFALVAGREADGYERAALYLEEQSLIHLKRSKEEPQYRNDAVNAMALALQYAGAIRRMKPKPPADAGKAGEGGGCK